MTFQDDEVIPEALTRTAFRNANEMAWKQEDCAAVIAWLRDSGYAVLGMELWLPDDDGIRTAMRTKAGPAIYCSACNPVRNERWDDYVRRSASETLDSITSFRWPEDSDEPQRAAYFNITWASRRWFREHSRASFDEQSDAETYLVRLESAMNGLWSVLKDLLRLPRPR